jgi:MFS family permease
VSGLVRLPGRVVWCGGAAIEQGSLVITVQISLTFCAGLLIGPVVDKYGPGKAILAGVIFCSLFQLYITFMLIR